VVQVVEEPHMLGYLQEQMVLREQTTPTVQEEMALIFQVVLLDRLDTLDSVTTPQAHSHKGTR
jgi:hypothetical protein